MSSSMSGSSSLSIPKWQIAIGLGAAGAIGAVGLGYWYISSTKNRQSVERSNISIDESGDIETNQNLSPLELAQKYKQEGNDLFKSGKFNEAIRLYNKAIETCPEENKTELAMYYQNRAAAYESLKKYSAVVADCTKAIELNSKYEKALMRRAKAYEILKDYENCLDDVTCVCLLQQFQNQSAITMADRVLRELGKKHAAEAMKNRKPVKLSTTFIKTYYLSYSQDPVYDMLMESNEPMGQGELTGFLKAKLAFATEMYDEIIPACTEEIQASEAEAHYKIEALSLRASFYFLVGSFDKALEDFTAVIDNPEADLKIRINCLLKRASIYMQTDQLPLCLKDFDKAVELGPNVSDIYHHRGQIKLLMEKTDEATQDFRKAVELNPNYSIAYVQKCYADYRYALQQTDMTALVETLDNFRRTIKKFPNCVETYVLYAQVLMEKHSYEEAEKLYKQALNIDPKNATVYVHQGLLKLQWKAAIDEAIELMREAIRIDDACIFAYETLGTVEVQRGNLLIAIELFNKAIELARSEMEITHLFSLRDAAMAQLKVTTRLGIDRQFMQKT